MNERTTDRLADANARLKAIITAHEKAVETLAEAVRFANMALKQFAVAHECAVEDLQAEVDRLEILDPDPRD